MKKYRFTEAAEHDLAAIVEYTKAIWGAAQAEKYLNGLHDRLCQLAETPRVGVAQEEYAAGLLKFPYARHILYYTQTEYGIHVIRILHERMNPYSHLEGKA